MGSVSFKLLMVGVVVGLIALTYLLKKREEKENHINQLRAELIKEESE